MYLKFGDGKFDIIDFKRNRHLFTDYYYITGNCDFTKYFTRKNNILIKNI